MNRTDVRMLQAPFTLHIEERDGFFWPEIQNSSLATVWQSPMQFAGYEAKKRAKTLGERTRLQMIALFKVHFQ